MKHIVNFFKGIALGISIIVPGVSGGTLALILGIYDKLIHAVSTLFKKFKENIVFLSTLGLGAIISILAFSSIINYGFKNAPFEINFLFLGLIIGSLPTLLKQVEFKEVKPPCYLWFVLGLAVVLAIFFIKADTAAGDANFFTMFIAGFVVCVAFIIPGISGSYLLLAIGLYKKVTSLLAFDNNFQKIIANLTELLPFGLGIVLGLIATVKAIEYLLKNHKNSSYLAIIGFVTGSAITLFAENIPYDIHILYSLLTFATGCAIAYFLNRWDKKTA